jgi:hypothetical protein
MGETEIPQQTRNKLKQMLGVQNAENFQMLGYTVNLQKSTIIDNLAHLQRMESFERLIPTLLSHYSQGTIIELTGKLVKFRGLPGGNAYEAAFIERAVIPVARAFADRAQDLIDAAKLLGGRPLEIGDCSVEVTPLRGIPLTYILWVADEFPAAANLLYDQSASSYLPTEDLALLGELATRRLIRAGELKSILKKTRAQVEARESQNS